MVWGAGPRDTLAPAASRFYQQPAPAELSTISSSSVIPILFRHRLLFRLEAVEARNLVPNLDDLSHLRPCPNKGISVNSPGSPIASATICGQFNDWQESQYLRKAPQQEEAARREAPLILVLAFVHVAR